METNSVANTVIQADMTPNLNLRSNSRHGIVTKGMLAAILNESQNLGLEKERHISFFSPHQVYFSSFQQWPIKTSKTSAYRQRLKS
jgi:hypothetical protein